jgi:selenocysteine lyase/cysteine desulfurase
MSRTLDIPFVRQHFPMYHEPQNFSGHFFDSAAGSFPCTETIDALAGFYRNNKLQPGNPFSPSDAGMEKMLYSKHRWANALGVQTHEIGFGPSTSQNTYVLAHAFSQWLTKGDEVIVTNCDHESNTGAIRRAVEQAGATVREWQVDAATGLLLEEDLSKLLNASTKLVCFPHASNVTGQKTDAKKIIEMAHAVGALTLVDGVSFAPHAIPDVDALGADIYVFSLYKVYSVHLGIMVIRQATQERLPKQGHFFKDVIDVNERFVPAGPDHAQIAAAGGVIDYIETLAAHHGDANLSDSGGPDGTVRDACEFVSSLWRQHETELVRPLLDFFKNKNAARMLGSFDADTYRCPLVSFRPNVDSCADVAHMLIDQGQLVSHGHFYAPRLLDAVGIDSQSGVIRISMAHYNSHNDVAKLIQSLDSLL